MSKTLYTLRPSDGKVVAYQNGTWKAVGAVQGFVQPRSGSDMLATWFKFDGKLHCAFLAIAKTVVARLDGGDLVPVAELETETIRAAWGTAINWGGSMTWAERLEDGTTYLYRFDGSLRCDEVTGIPGVEGQFIAASEALQLAPQGQKIKILPSAISLSPALEAGKFLGRVYDVELDVQVDVVYGQLSARYSGEWPPFLNAPMDAAGLKAISVFVAGNDEYTVTADGWLVGSNGLKKDLRTDSIDHIPVEWASPDMLKITPKFVSKVGDSFVGARLTSKDSKTRTVIGFHDGRILDTIGDATFETNEELVFAPGFAMGSTSESFSGAVSRVHWMATPKGFVVAILGRSNTPGAPSRSPSLLAEYDGKTVRVRKLPALSVAGSCAAYDASVNSVHLLFHDADTGKVRHVTYNLSSGAISPATDLWDQEFSPIGQGVADGTFAAYEDGEPDARIVDLVYDAETGDVKLTIEKVNASLALEYTKDSKWLKADYVDQTDTGLVHHLRREEPSYVGPIQYRVVVTRA